MYAILAGGATEEYVYCTFEERCGVPGPWTRVSYLNMSDSCSVCPSGTQKFVQGSATACGIQEYSATTCVQISMSAAYSYSQICGRVAGYQKGTPDGLSLKDINEAYVDGVSITRGSPRQHVWTYVAGYGEMIYPCPCDAGSEQQVPSFVGSDYYCESGYSGNSGSLSAIYWDDVLWDGQQCGGLETDCCTPGQPWFHKVLSAQSSDSIEIRLCIDENTDNENSLVSLYEIYVK